MVVTILDLAGNPVANATVTWSASGGTLSATTTTTDAAGQTSVTVDDGCGGSVHRHGGLTGRSGGHVYDYRDLNLRSTS